MTPRTIKLSPQVSNAQVMIEPPLGVVYDSITLELRNSALGTTAGPTLASCLGNIEIRAAGAIQRSATAVRMAAKNALLGADYAPLAYVGPANGTGVTHLRILFREPRTRLRPDSVDVDKLGWKTAWIPRAKPFQILCANALGASLVVRAWADVHDLDDSATRGPGKIVKLFTDESVLGAQTSTVKNWAGNVKTGDKFLSLFLPDSSGGKTVTDVRLEAGGAIFYEDVPKNILTSQLRGADLSPAGADAVANGVHLVFDRRENMDDALPAFANSKLDVTMSAAANGESIYIVSERYGLPEGYGAA